VDTFNSQSDNKLYNFVGVASLDSEAPSPCSKIMTGLFLVIVFIAPSWTNSSAPSTSIFIHSILVSAGRILSNRSVSTFICSST